MSTREIDTLLVIKATIGAEPGVPSAAAVVDESTGKTSARYLYDNAQRDMEDNRGLKKSNVVVLTNDVQASGMSDCAEAVINQDGNASGPALAGFLKEHPEYKFVVLIPGEQTLMDYDNTVVPLLTSYKGIPTAEATCKKRGVDISQMGQAAEVFRAADLIDLSQDPVRNTLPGFREHVTGAFQSLPDYQVVGANTLKALNQESPYFGLSPKLGLFEQSLANTRAIVGYLKGQAMKCHFATVLNAGMDLGLKTPGAE